MIAWKPPKIWPGATVFIIGGGPSITQDQLKLLCDSKNRGKYRIIGCNKAYREGSWIDAIWCGDDRYFFKYRNAMVREYNGLRISLSNAAERDKHFKWMCKFRGGKKQMRQLEKMMKDSLLDPVVFRTLKKNPTTGICPLPGYICWNSNTGSSAINLAYHFGARKIALMGFDMQSLPIKNPTSAQRKTGITRQTHYHEGYPEWGGPSKKLPYNRYRRRFPVIAQHAKLLGLEIIDCSLNGALTQFPKIPVERVIIEECQAHSSNNLI